MNERIGKFRCRDGSMTRIADTAAPEAFRIEDENALPATEFRELEELGAMNEKRARDIETFVQASKARWAKPDPDSANADEPSEDDGPGPFGGNLSASKSSLFPTPGERAQRMASTSDGMSPAERFAAASKARWAKK